MALPPDRSSRPAEDSPGFNSKTMGNRQAGGSTSSPTAGSPVKQITEDDPRWNYKTMGNHQGGPGATLPRPTASEDVFRMVARAAAPAAPKP